MRLPTHLVFLIPILFLTSTSTNAQLALHGNIWRFGNDGGLDFTSGTPVVVPGAVMDSYEGCAVYCDAAGQLLFYTNGGGSEFNNVNGARKGIIWNRNGQVMYDMGDDTGGGYSAAQSSSILPKPGSLTEYYLFTMDDRASLTAGDNRGLSYFIIDMTLNGGLGGVTTTDVRIHTPAVECLTAVPKSNGSGYWIITIDETTRDFVVVSLDASGVGTPVLRDRNASDDVAVIKASPDGKWICANSELYAFNATDGTFTFAATLGVSNYSLSFSPSSRYLYSFTDDSGFSPLVRYDLKASDIPASVEVVQNIDFTFGGLMQLGPDGNLYLAEITALDSEEGKVSVSQIKCPDGVFPTFNRSLFRFNGDPLNADGVFTSLPNFADYIFASTTDADTTTTTMCAGSGAQLIPPPGPHALEYQWSTGDTATGIVVTAPGLYSVSVTDSCSISVYHFDVSVDSAIANIAVPAFDSLCSALPFALSVDAGIGTVTGYLWSNGTTADTLLIAQPGTYGVTVTTTCGTVTATYTTPEDDCCKAYFPNAFTPDGDGKNDQFGPVFPGCEVEDYELTVYARWGEQVHFGYKANELWDGTVNGLPAVTDVYIYVLKYKLAGEAPKTQKGEVALIR